MTSPQVTVAVPVRDRREQMLRCLNPQTQEQKIKTTVAYGRTPGSGKFNQGTYARGKTATRPATANDDVTDHLATG